MIHWTICHHVGEADKSCLHYRMPHRRKQKTLGRHKHCFIGRKGFLSCVTFPIFKRKRVISVAPASYTQTWEVTWYGPTGNAMANNEMPFIGAAACGYDVPLGTQISVPGVGPLTCLDRIGFNPWHHVDVFGYRPGLGNDYRTVTVY